VSGEFMLSTYFLGEYIMSQEMSVKKDLKCVFNMPEKIKSEFNNEEEMSHSLPPHSPVDIYPVDEYEACPTNWMHGSDMASSYFVGVKEDHGMWLDFNECFYHTHDVAVVISIQGINPITGQKMVAEKALRLEQYHKKCPIHNVNFKQDRYCEKCGFKWPGQNYLSTTGTPEMMMWLDGFRTPEGKVRQYIFTEDKMRGVAAQLIGEERVFAIGIAYYLSKSKKPYILKRPQARSYEDDKVNFSQPMFFSPCHTPQNWDNKMDMTLCSNSNVDQTPEVFSNNLLDTNFYNKAISSSPTASHNSRVKMRASASVNPSNILQSSVKPVTPVKKLEIGAGALISQRVYDDPKMISYWESEPAGMIYINYCDEETKKKILDGGRRADVKDGFMKDIKIGG